MLSANLKNSSESKDSSSRLGEAPTSMLSLAKRRSVEEDAKVKNEMEQSQQ
jgi:hypothetical protein